jgi:hypothetical protein
MIRRRLGAIIGALTITLTLVGPVAAAAPSNDDIGAPTAIALPSTTSQSTVEGTAGSTDPSDCGAGGPTVWFSYLATTDGALQLQTFGSDYDTVLVLGISDDAGGIIVLACNDDAGGLQSAVRFAADAGATYLVMVGSFGGGDGGSLVLNLEVAPPPPFIDLTIDPAATFTPAGTATVRGTIACTADLQLFDLTVVLEQRVGRVVISGFGFAEGATCGPTPTPWTLLVSGDNGKFLGGRATARGFAFGCDFECTEASAAAEVRLRR